jgi:hypothetical protein
MRQNRRAFSLRNLLSKTNFGICNFMVLYYSQVFCDLNIQYLKLFCSDALLYIKKSSLSDA